MNPNTDAANPTTTPTSPLGQPSETKSERQETTPTNFDDQLIQMVQEQYLGANERKSQIRSLIHLLLSNNEKVWERTREALQQYQQYIQSQREQVNQILANPPQRQPITKAEAIAVALATLFNPRAGGAAAAGILGQRESRYKADMERYQALAENALRRYQLESQAMGQLLKSELDMHEIELARSMQTIQSLFGELTEADRNQLNAIQQLRDLEYKRRRLELDNLRLEVQQARTWGELTLAYDRLQNAQRQTALAALRLLNTVAANMTPEQMRGMLTALIPEMTETWSDDAMTVFYRSLSQNATLNQRLREARANIAQIEADLLRQFGERKMQLDLKILEERAALLNQQQQLNELRAMLAQHNLQDVKEGKIPPSMIPNLLWGLFMLDQIESTASEHEREQMRESLTRTRSTLLNILAVATRQLNLPAPAGTTTAPATGGARYGTPTISGQSSSRSSGGARIR